MIYTVLLVLTLSFSINLLLIFLANRIGLVDDPGGKKLAIHKKPIPISGGLAIVLSTLASISLFALSHFLNLRDYYWVILAIFLPATLIATFGIVDDLKGISPIIRLFYQSIISFLILIIILPGFSFFLIVTAVLLTILILITISATNMTDGMDGLCGTMALITLFSYFLVSKGEIINFYLLSLMLAVFVFLIFNFNPAKIFLGNCGSEFLGFSIGLSAVILILTSAKALQIVLIILMIGVPIADMFFAILRRAVKHQPITSGDRDHIYDKILKRGFSQKKVWLILTIAQIAINGFAVYFYFQFK